METLTRISKLDSLNVPMVTRNPNYFKLQGELFITSLFLQAHRSQNFLKNCPLGQLEAI